MSLSLFAIAEPKMKILPFSLKMRAREHFFENHRVNTSTETTEYGGLSNTINLWWEKPFHSAIGFYWTPVLGQSTPKGEATSELGSSFQLVCFGLEGKYFLWSHSFVRAGIGSTQLKSKGTLDTASGSNHYFGLGWEFKTKWGFGIAPEFGYRKSSLENAIEVESQIFAIGFHFYELI
jgi:hypothetical protein